MTVEELKNMSAYEVKNFIRQRLMYTEEEIDKVCNDAKKNGYYYDLLRDTKPNLTLHHRFDLTGQGCHRDLLGYFDYLGLKKAFYDYKLFFHDGCATFEYQLTYKSNKIEENLCGFGTVDIIHFIMSKAWGLKGV
jgi:hypothetical protein